MRSVPMSAIQVVGADSLAIKPDNLALFTELSPPYCLLSARYAWIRLEALSASDFIWSAVACFRISSSRSKIGCASKGRASIPMQISAMLKSSVSMGGITNLRMVKSFIQCQKEPQWKSKKQKEHVHSSHSSVSNYLLVVCSSSLYATEPEECVWKRSRVTHFSSIGHSCNRTRRLTKDFETATICATIWTGQYEVLMVFRTEARILD